MQNTLSSYLISSFSEKVHGVAERGGLLKAHLRVDHANAMDHYFPALGKALASERGPMQPVMPAPTEKKRPKADLRNREHWEFLDRYQVEQTNVKVMAKYGMHSRNACERACDQMGIVAIKSPNAQSIGTLAQSRPAASEAITLANSAKWITALLDKGVMLSDLAIIYSEKNFQVIAQMDQLLSSRYSARGLVESGRIPPLFGMKWIGVEARLEGGVEAADGWIVSSESTGIVLGGGYGSAMAHTAWREDIQSWQIGAMFLGGSSVIDRNEIAVLNLKQTI